jgi:hypothetical protein
MQARLVDRVTQPATSNPVVESKQMMHACSIDGFISRFRGTNSVALRMKESPLMTKLQVRFQMLRKGRGRFGAAREGRPGSLR